MQSSEDQDPRGDEDLIRSIRNGDVEAFEALYQRYRGWIAALAYRFCSNREDALDVLQEVFAYLLKKLPELALKGRLTTFLYPAVKHLALNLRRRVLPLSAADLDTLNAASAADPPADPLSTEDLRVALTGLSEEHREVVLLRYLDGLSLEEIAAALKLPPGTVKSRLHYALKALRADPRARRYFEG